jgi:hypothetical protein
MSAGQQPLAKLIFLNIQMTLARQCGDEVKCKGDANFFDLAAFGKSRSLMVAAL